MSGSAPGLYAEFYKSLYTDLQKSALCGAPQRICAKFAKGMKAELHKRLYEKLKKGCTWNSTKGFIQSSQEMLVDVFD